MPLAVFIMLSSRGSTIIGVCWLSVALLAATLSLTHGAAVGVVGSAALASGAANAHVTSNSSSTALAAPASGAPSPTERRVIYIDYRDVNYNDGGATVRAAVDAGYNTVIIAFWLLSGTKCAHRNNTLNPWF